MCCGPWNGECLGGMGHGWSWVLGEGQEAERSISVGGK